MNGPSFRCESVNLRLLLEITAILRSSRASFASRAFTISPWPEPEPGVDTIYCSKTTSQKP
jgi:hypothetical protein